MSPTRNLASLALLHIPTMAYTGAVRLRNRYYDTSSAVRRAGVPVISVGNLTVGGTGKTPMVAWLVRELQGLGHKPAVVSRGYRGTAGRGPLVVSRGAAALVGPERCGDEPYLLARSLPGALVVGSDRFSGAEQARRLGADVVVLDDGFQHRRLARDFDLVLVDASNPFGNYRLLPAGVLREPLTGLARADAVVLTRTRPGESLVVIERVIRRHHPGVPVFRAGHRRLAFVDASGAAVPPPARAAAFCGIGNPQLFFEDLHAHGVEVVASRVFADHHKYAEDDWAELQTLARRADAALVTTEKDLVRFAFVPPDELRVCALRIETQVHDREALLELVRAALARGPR